MNRISQYKEAQAIRLFLAGESIRHVARTVGIHHMTSMDIKHRMTPVFGQILCACGRPSGHKHWCGHRIAQSPARIAWLTGTLRNIATLNIYVPSRPRYERPDIPGERETEIPLLVNRRSVLSMDAPRFGGDENGHTLFKNDQLNPLEILLLKEERESEEWIKRQHRIDEFRRFESRRRSAFFGTALIP